MVSSLMLATILVALVIAVFLFARHMRKPENRHPMDGERERNIAEIRDEAPKRDGL